MRSDKFAITLSLFLCLSCGKQPGQSDICPSIFPLQISHPQSSSPERVSRLFEDIDYVRLESSSKEMIVGAMGRIQFVKDTYYIHDIPSSSILMFSSDGKFINRISHRGRGKGEYIVLSCYDVNRTNGNVCIYDNSTRKVSIFDRNGVFLSSIQTEDIARSFAVLDNGDLVFSAFDYMEGNRFGIWQTDSLGHFKKYITPEKTSFYFNSGFHLNDGFFHLNDCVCISGNEENDYLYHIAPDTSFVAGQISPDIEIPRRLRHKKESVRMEEYAGKVYTKFGYMETSGAMTISATDMVHTSALFYDKNNGQTYYFSGNETEAMMENDLKKPLAPWISCFEGGFIGVFLPEFQDCGGELVKKMFPGLKPDDNPILVIMKTR